MSFWRPHVDHELRDRGLGQVASAPISSLPATQVIATGGPVILANAFAGLQLVWPSSAAEIVSGTIHTASVARFFEELEGVVDAELHLQFQDQTAGGAQWTISAINGTALDTGSQAIATTVTVGAAASTQNSFVNARFRNRALIAPFPGTVAGRRYIDTAIQVEHDQPGARTVQIVATHAILYRATYR